MRRLLALCGLVALAATVVGCGGVSQSGLGGRRSSNYGSQAGANSDSRKRAREQREKAAKADDADAQAAAGQATGQVQVISNEPYEGWDCLKLKNGLVTMVVVPDLGGRVMEYKLSGYPFFFVNDEEKGRLYPPEQQITAQREWHNFGGFKVWPAPQSAWGERLAEAWPPPATFDAMPFASEVLDDKAAAAVRMESIPDPEGTGLQTSRELRLYGGGTHVSVKETFTNVTNQPVKWGIWDITQVRGALEADKPYSEKAMVYFPLSRKSKHERGFVELTKGEETEMARAQWKPNIVDGIMGVTYLQNVGKIGADSPGGWIAYVDELHSKVYVKRFEVFPDEDYPDQDSTVAVYTDGELPYIEMEVMGPVREIPPGESYTFDIDWYSCSCNGPIRDCTDTGVIAQPLALKEQADQDPVLTGKFGIFYRGSARVLLLDDKGQAREYKKVPVSPAQPLELNEPLSLDDTVQKIVLQIVNENGQPFSEKPLAELKVK